AAVRKRHGKSVATDERDTVDETRPGCERLTHGAVFLRQVQHGHLAAEACRKLTRGAADAAAHVQYAVGVLDGHGAGKRERASKTKPVIVVHRSQLRHRHLLRIDPMLAYCLFDALHQARPSVVAANRPIDLVLRHSAFPSSSGPPTRL